MDNLSFLIKPVSGSCNMRCRYCFYEDLGNIRLERNFGKMSDQTVENLVCKAFRTAEKKKLTGISFAFQGGEPTLAGLPFFRHFVETVNRYKTDKVKVSYALQTNGYSTSPEWIEFYKANNFLVGLSIDGREGQHDYFRIDADGEGTYARVSGNARLLLSSGVETNALCVITSRTNPVRTYRALKNLGFQYLQFIPCLDPMEEERGKREFSLSREHYADFLCTTFELWYNDWKEGHYTSVRLFDDLVHILTGQPAGSCQLGGSCGKYIVVEADGSIYPCDFYVLDEWKAGNINDEEDEEDGLLGLFEGDVYDLFLDGVSMLPRECWNCRYRDLCNAGCRRDRDYQGLIGSNYYCESFKSFFSFASSRLEEVARAELAMMYGGR